MNTKNTVFAKLFNNKTKLSKKVKLGILQDIDSELSVMLQDFADYESIVESRLSVSIELEALKGEEYIKAQNLLDNRTNILNQLEDYKRKAEELGVDTDTSYYDNALDNLETNIKFASPSDLGLRF
tara:strand:+ start:22 stop:399 length:378 start_codon:yes stop_codon:yes gene_type:complete